MPISYKPNLNQMFSPNSVAIIGASKDKKKIGAIALRNIIESGFEGEIYPINPNAEQIQNKKCYPNVSEVPGKIDLAIVSVPSSLVIKVFEDINHKGIKNVVVYTAGYKETGEEGKKLEVELTEFCKKNEINMLGPNCMGFVNNQAKINASFGQNVDLTGNLKFISQSGAIAAALFDWSKNTEVGFDEFVTLGNKSLLGENQILNHWIESKQSKSTQSGYVGESEISNSGNKGHSDYEPIGMYLESIQDGKNFVEIVKKITVNDPVFVLKPGKSKAAKQAMQSHTGSIAGEDSVLDAALKECGVIRCDGIQDMFEFSRAYAWENAPNGPNVAIVSNAGGPAVISADIVEKVGLNLAPTDLETRKKMAQHLPRAASLLNPIDVLGDALADRYNTAIEAVLQERDIDSVVVILTPQVVTEIEKTAKTIGELSKKYPKPIYCTFIGGSKVYEGEKVLNRYKIPSFSFPERALKALGKIYEWNQWREVYKKNIGSVSTLHEQVSKKVEGAIGKRTFDIINTSRGLGRVSLSSLEAQEVLHDWGIKVPASRSVMSFDQCQDFVQENEFPVVLKLSSPKVLHKTEIGGVITNIRNENELNEKFIQMDEVFSLLDPLARKATNIQIQKQVEGGVEVILGIKEDPNFGPVMMFGAGGIYVELIQDRNLLLLPVDEKDAITLVQNSKVSKILGGYRGKSKLDLDGLYKLITKLSGLYLHVAEFEDIEINPVIVTEKNVWAVDGKILLKKK